MNNRRTGQTSTYHLLICWHVDCLELQGRCISLWSLVFQMQLCCKHLEPISTTRHITMKNQWKTNENKCTTHEFLNFMDGTNFPWLFHGSFIGFSYHHLIKTYQPGTLLNSWNTKIHYKQSKDQWQSLQSGCGSN